MEFPSEILFQTHYFFNLQYYNKAERIIKLDRILKPCPHLYTNARRMQKMYAKHIM